MVTVSAEANKLVTKAGTDTKSSPIPKENGFDESGGKKDHEKNPENTVYEEEKAIVGLTTENSEELLSVKQVSSDEEDKIVPEKEEVFKNIAYGKQEKDQVAASIYTISGEEILATRANNLLIALQGKVPGLEIFQHDGNFGSEAVNVNLRGQDSPNSNAITYLVDGVERHPMTVDLYDIESVTVLKDAAASAMFGMRSAGGVVLINTKRGIEGEAQVNVTVDHAIQSPNRLPDIVSAYDYVNMYNQRKQNDNAFADAQDIAAGGTGLTHSEADFYSEEEIEHYRKGDNTEFYPVRDMLDDFLKDFTQLTRVNVNFRGGSNMMKYYTSLGYHHQEGLFENEPFDEYSYDAETKSNQFNFRTNLDISVNETLDFYANIGGYMRKNNGPYSPIGGILNKLYDTPNNAHNDLTPDNEVLIKRDKLQFNTGQSVYGELNRTGSRKVTETRLGNTFGFRQDLNKVLNGLSVNGEFSFDIYSANTELRSRQYEAWEVATLTDVNGADSLGYKKVPGTNNTTLSDGQHKFFEYKYDMRLSGNYDRTFNEKHDLSALLLAERYMQQREILPNDNYMWLSGRLAYGFDNRLFLEGNFSYQGSQQYAEDQRFGFFPSVAAAWVMSNETFLEDVDAISYLKLRASVGNTGNYVYPYGSSNQYLYLSTWNADASEDQLGNPSFQWETYTKYNLGVEAELFNSFYFGGDYFYHDNRDIVVRDVGIIPDGFMGIGGASLPPLNIGKTMNSGFEFVAGYNKQISSDLRVSFDGNVSFAENEVLDMAELPYDDSYAHPYRRKGYSVDLYWGYKTDGLFNTQEEIDGWHDQSALGGVPIPGDIKYLDITGDGVVDQRDVAPLGEGPQPDIVYGLNTKIVYKGFDINVFINGAEKRNVFLHGFGRWSNNDNFVESMKDTWTEEKYVSGEAITGPRLGRNSTNYHVSDYWIENGSYIRLRNLEIGFTLPENLTQRINANSIRLYVNGLNLFTLDNLPNDDFDPETAFTNNAGFPVMKAYNFGVSMRF